MINLVDPADLFLGQVVSSEFRRDLLSMLTEYDDRDVEIGSELDEETRE